MNGQMQPELQTKTVKNHELAKLLANFWPNILEENSHKYQCQGLNYCICSGRNVAWTTYIFYKKLFCQNLSDSCLFLEYEMPLNLLTF